MTFFLRYTNAADEDLKRNNSFHASGLSQADSTPENVAALFGCDVDEVVLLDNGLYSNGIANGDMCYFQELDGLCGFELESETLEEAIKEAKEFVFNEVYNSDTMSDMINIFEGEYLTDNLEGCFFDAEKIVFSA